VPSDVGDLRRAHADIAIAFVGEPQHVDRAGQRSLDLGLQCLPIEIVGQFKGEFAGGLGDADAYVHVGPFDECPTIVGSGDERWNSSDVLIRWLPVIDAIGAGRR
jgi:hypothetical protein